MSEGGEGAYESIRARWYRRLRAELDDVAWERVLVLVAGLVVVVAICWLLAREFDVTLGDVFSVAAVVAAGIALMYLQVQLLPTKIVFGEAPPGPNDVGTSAGQDPAGFSGSPVGLLDPSNVSSRGRPFGGWPWRAVLRADRIEILRPLRPPVILPLQKAVYIEMEVGDWGMFQMVTLRDREKQILGHLSQGTFAPEFLAALAEVTGREISYLPYGGRPYGGGP